MKKAKKNVQDDFGIFRKRMSDSDIIEMFENGIIIEYADDNLYDLS